MKTNLQIIREIRELLRETARLISIIAPAHGITDTLEEEEEGE